MHNTFRLAHFCKIVFRKIKLLNAFRKHSHKTQKFVLLREKPKTTKIKFTPKIVLGLHGTKKFRFLLIEFTFLPVFISSIRPYKHVCSWFSFFTFQVKFDKEIKNVFKNVNKFATRRLWTIIQKSTYFAQ